MYWGFYTVAADGIFSTNEDALNQQEDVRPDSMLITLPADADIPLVSTEKAPVRKASYIVTFIGSPPQPWFPKQ